MSASAALIAAFDKEFGGNTELAPITYLDTGFALLNEGLSGSLTGGLAQGRLHEVAGESGTGKTGFLTDLFAQAQKAGGCAGLIDWERTFNEMLAVNGYGMSTEKPYWFYKRPRTWEEGNMVALKYCQWVRANKVIAPEAPLVVGFDSIASAIPQSSAGTDFDKLTMNDTTALARVTSTTLKSMAMFADDFNATFIYLNQIRLKPGISFGDPRTTPGGKAMEFFATTRLMLGKNKVVQQVDGEKEFVGQNITFQVVKSKLTKPFSECTMRLSFNEEGCAFFDKDYSLVEALIDQKKIPTPRKGYVEWEGKQLAKRAFADLVTAESLQAKLVALLSA